MDDKGNSSVQTAALGETLENQRQPICVPGPSHRSSQIQALN